jgi:hypothetical protein
MNVKDEDLQGLDQALDKLELALRIGEHSAIREAIDNLKTETRRIFDAAEGQT